MSLKMVFLMDPVERVNIDADSTFVLMLEAQRRGHEVLYAHPRALALQGGDPWISARPIELRRKRGDHFTLRDEVRLPLQAADVVFSRKDPPFDIDYLVTTYILDRVDRSRVVMVNDPTGIRDLNEKLAALRFAHVMPRTFVSANRADLRAFIDEVGDAVVKPLMGAGGSGVVRLARGDRNIGSVLDILTSEGLHAIEAQVYLPAIVEGDKRVILLDGVPVGAVNRRPRSDDIRANLHVGGSAEPAVVDDRDRAICAELEPELERHGIVFAGIDVIGGMLTEINVTSPTGIQEIDRFDGVCLEARFIDAVEAKRASL